MSGGREGGKCAGNVKEGMCGDVKERNVWECEGEECAAMRMREMCGDVKEGNVLGM